MDLSYIKTCTERLVIHEIKLKMSRFQKYRLKKKTEFQRLKRLEKLVEEYFPQIWEFFEILEETTITDSEQTGPTTGTGEEERPVTAVTNPNQTGPPRLAREKKGR